MRTEIMNSAMEQLLDGARRLQPTQLDPSLEAYLSHGLAVQADGAVVSVAASQCANADRSWFVDTVGYEAFVNKIHLDDWCSNALADATVEDQLAHALVLADRIGAWAEEQGAQVAVIISVDPGTRDVVFRFHGIRPDEPPWLAGIEQYTEPVFLRLYGRLRLDPALNGWLDSVCD